MKTGIQHALAILLVALSFPSEALAETPAAAAAPTPASAPATVTPKFTWEPGLKANVTFTTSRTRVVDKRTTTATEGRYTLSVLAEGPNLRIHISDPKLGKKGGASTTDSTMTQARVIEQLAAMAPDFVVARSGEFVKIHDLPGFQGRIKAFFTEHMPKGTDSTVGRNVLDQVTSEAFLTSRIADEWNAVVGSWLGGVELQLGQEYETTAREPIPMMPGEQVIMRKSFSASRRVDCRRGGVDRDCVELIFTSSTDPDDTKQVLQAALSRLGDQALSGMVFKTIEIETKILVVTEPNGLLPHRYKLTKTVRGVAAIGQEERTLDQIDERETTYEW